jgi:hypothetical protein
MAIASGQAIGPFVIGFVVSLSSVGGGLLFGVFVCLLLVLSIGPAPARDA